MSSTAHRQCSIEQIHGGADGVDTHIIIGHFNRWDLIHEEGAQCKTFHFRDFGHAMGLDFLTF